jgi:superfamily II DNA or RNA helicase
MTGSFSRRAARKRWSFAGELNDLQKEATGACMDSFDKHRGGILSLYCGAGKTVCALYLAATLGRKTLVVVAKSFLCDQACVCVCSAGAQVDAARALL